MKLTGVLLFLLCSKIKKKKSLLVANGCNRAFPPLPLSEPRSDVRSYTAETSPEMEERPRVS